MRNLIKGEVLLRALFELGNLYRIDKIDTVEGNSVEIEGVRYVMGRTYIDEVRAKILSSSL